MKYFIIEEEEKSRLTLFEFDSAIQQFVDQNAKNIRITERNKGFL